MSLDSLAASFAKLSDNARERRKGWLRMGADDAFLHCARMPEILATMLRARKQGADISVTHCAPDRFYAFGTLRIDVRRDRTDQHARVHSTIRLRLREMPIVDHDGDPTDACDGQREVVRQQILEGRTRGAVLTKEGRYQARFAADEGGPLGIVVLEAPARIETPAPIAEVAPVIVERDPKPENVQLAPEAPEPTAARSELYERGRRSIESESPDYIRGVIDALQALGALPRTTTQPRAPRANVVTTPEELAARRKEAARKAVETRRARMAGAA